MSTREQVEKIRAEHPNWSKADIAKAVVPPVTPQRIGQIENGIKVDSTEEYRERIRHKYHKRAPKKYKRKKCKLCLNLPLDKE